MTAPVVAVLAAKPSRADERKRHESRAISSSARARVSSIHAREPAGKDADAQTRGAQARQAETMILTRSWRCRARDDAEESTKPTRKMDLIVDGRICERQNAERVQAHAHAHTRSGGVVLLARVAAGREAAFGSARSRRSAPLGTARRGSTRLGLGLSARLRATWRGADPRIERVNSLEHRLRRARRGVRDIPERIYDDKSDRLGVLD